MPSPRRSFIQTAKGQLHCRRNGAGPTIVLLQVLPFTGAMFEPLTAALADRYDCIVIDLMGYGHSDARAGAWTVQDHAAALHEALDLLKIDPVCVLGGHTTAMVATELAVVHPDRVGKLVLDGVPLFPLEIKQQRLSAMEAPKAFSEDGADLAELWAQAVGLMRKFDPDLTLTPENKALVACYAFNFILAYLGRDAGQMIFSYDLHARLQQLTTPTLVIASPTDSMRHRHEEAMALIPGAREYVFEDINPLYRMSQPRSAETYAKVLDDFIRQTQMLKV